MTSASSSAVDSSSLSCPFNECLINGLEFGGTEALVNHLSVDHFDGYTPYKCKLCGASTTSHEQALLHVKYRHCRMVDAKDWIMYHGDTDVEEQIAAHVEQAAERSRTSRASSMSGTSSGNEHQRDTPTSTVAKIRKIQSVTDKLLKAAALNQKQHSSTRLSCENDETTPDTCMSGSNVVSDYEDNDQRDGVGCVSDVCQLCDSQIDWSDPVGGQSLRQTRMLHVLKVHMKQHAYFCPADACDYSSNDYSAVRSHSLSVHKQRSYRRRLTNVRTQPEFLSLHEQCFGCHPDQHRPHIQSQSGIKIESNELLLTAGDSSDVSQRSTPLSACNDGYGLAAELDPLQQLLAGAFSAQQQQQSSQGVSSSDKSPRQTPSAATDASKVIPKRTCNLCNAHITDKTNYLRQHAITHSDVMLYRCGNPACGGKGLAFKDLRSARTHERTVHKTADEWTRARLTQPQLEELTHSMHHKCFGDGDLGAVDEPCFSEEFGSPEVAAASSEKPDLTCQLCGLPFKNKTYDKRKHAQSHIDDNDGVHFCAHPDCQALLFRSHKAGLVHCDNLHAGDGTFLTNSPNATQQQRLLDAKLVECFGLSSVGEQNGVSSPEKPTTPLSSRPRRSRHIPLVDVANDLGMVACLLCGTELVGKRGNLRGHAHSHFDEQLFYCNHTQCQPKEIRFKTRKAAASHCMYMHNNDPKFISATKTPDQIRQMLDEKMVHCFGEDIHNSTGGSRPGPDSVLSEDYDDTSQPPMDLLPLGLGPAVKYSGGGSSSPSLTALRARNADKNTRDLNRDQPMVACAVCGLEIQAKSNNKKQHAHIHIPEKMFYCSHPKCVAQDLCFSARRLCNSHCTQYHSADDKGAEYVSCKVSDEEFRETLSQTLLKCFPAGQQLICGEPDVKDENSMECEGGGFELEEPDEEALPIMRDSGTPNTKGSSAGMVDCAMCGMSVKRDSRPSHAQSHNPKKFFYCTEPKCAEKQLMFKTRRAIREHCNKTHKQNMGLIGQTESDDYVKKVNDELMAQCFPATTNGGSAGDNADTEDSFASQPVVKQEPQPDEDDDNDSDDDTEATGGTRSGAMQPHSEECQLCEATIIVHKSSCRRLHAQIHLIDKLYFCGFDDCGLQFQTRASCRKHVRKTHNNKGDFVRFTCTEHELNEKIASITELCFGGGTALPKTNKVSTPAAARVDDTDALEAPPNSKKIKLETQESFDDNDEDAPLDASLSTDMMSMFATDDPEDDEPDPES